MKKESYLELKVQMLNVTDLIQEVYEQFDTSESEEWSKALEKLLEDAEDMTKAIKYCFKQD